MQVSVLSGDGLILFVWLRGRRTAHFLESALGLPSPCEPAHNPDPWSPVAHLSCSWHFSCFQSSFALKEHIVCKISLLFSNANGLLHNPGSKTGLVTTSWERLYFFTQGGNLMCQPRGAVAGGLIQDLDNCSVMAVDCEDRRYCFQITTPNGKSYVRGFTWAENQW